FMQIYNAVTNVWSSGLNMPDFRSGPAVAAFNSKVYIIGGFAPGFVPQSQVWEYDPVANTYATKTSMPSASGNVPGALLGNEIFVVGGSSPNTAAYAYNPTTDTWRTITAPVPADCQAGGAFAFGGELWLFGCLGQTGTNVNADSYCYRCSYSNCNGYTYCSCYSYTYANMPHLTKLQLLDHYRLISGRHHQPGHQLRRLLPACPIPIPGQDLRQHLHQRP